MNNRHVIVHARDKEVAEIVFYERAVEIANLMLGKLDRNIKRIFPEDYQDLPRKNLRAGKADIKGKWREVENFCRDNFEGASPKNIAALYEPLYSHRGKYRLPLIEFIRIVGKPLEGRLKGAPLHSTVCLSPWGLQTEFPEAHLVLDIAFAYNAILKLKADIDEVEARKLSWSDAKKEKDEIAQKQSEMKYNMRMCLICCFNLIEAYINGIAWEYVKTKGTSSLSENQRKMIEGDQTSILEKLVKIPRIIAGRDSSPLNKEEPPLSEFRDIIKPYRDSIVHASPYSAPEKFGGYDKLSKIYELNPDIVKRAVDISLEIISKIHKFVGAEREFPQWIPTRNSNGLF